MLASAASQATPQTPRPLLARAATRPATGVAWVLSAGSNKLLFTLVLSTALKFSARSGWSPCTPSSTIPMTTPLPRQ
jgi:hypothetical protein